MNEIIEQENIEEMIYEIRGVQVMLDSDLARLYGCVNGTKTINQAVKRHINKFPKRYMFKLTNEEYRNICSPKLGPQINKNRTLPCVFTEQGVAMLATIIHTSVADRISMQIIDAFVAMRKYISSDLIKSNNMLVNHENRILKLEESFDKLSQKTKVNSIFYEGQIYDAYSLLIDIITTANEEIIIIDNYASKELLDILKSINMKIIIVTNNTDEVLKNKYKKQYHNVNFIQNSKFHDRFLIIDRKVLYHSGASFKGLGKKCFALNKIEDKNILNGLLSKLFI